MTTTIRLARADEARQLAALAIQVWLDTYSLEGMRAALADYVLDHLTPTHFQALLANPHKTVYVAERNSHLLGYAVYGRDTLCPVVVEDGAVELETLYVSRHFHRQGVGWALLAAMPAQAAIWLTTWYRNASIAFYRARGFVDIGATVFELDGEQHENRILLLPATVEAMP